MPMWIIAGGSLLLGGIGAHNQASASKKAAEQQVASIDKGLALQEKIYNEQKAGMQPYAQRGAQALGSLGDLMGFPALPPPQSSLGPVNGTQGPMNMSDPRVQHLAQGGGFEDMPGRTGTLGAAMGGGGASSYGQPSGAPGAGVMASGGMVKMQAPDGEERDVPEAMAAHFEQAGARRIG